MLPSSPLLPGLRKVAGQDGSCYRKANEGTKASERGLLCVTLECFLYILLTTLDDGLHSVDSGRTAYIYIHSLSNLRRTVSLH